VALATVLAACGGPVHRAPKAPVKPGQIIPGPAGLLAGGNPQANGTMWVVAGPGAAQNLQQVDLVSGQINKIVPLGTEADSVVESTSGTLAVGYADPGGKVEFRDGSSGALVSSVNVGAPVKAIAEGPTASTFYVLNGTATTTSVTTVSSTGSAEPPSIGVASNTVALAANLDQLYLLNDLGSVTELSLSTSGQPTANGSFFVGDGALRLALSPNGTSLFVLKSTGSAMNVGVFNVATEEQGQVIPAPANGVGLAVSIDGAHVYVLVGTPTLGNIQVFPVGK
jgi:hypothetical protein